MDYRLKSDENTVNLSVEKGDADNFTINFEEEKYDVKYKPLTENYIFLEIDGKAVKAYVADEGDTKTVVIDGQNYEISDADKLEQSSSGKKSGRDEPTEVTPPMPAVVVRTLVKEGDEVSKGDGVIVVSAMKMETTLNAPFNGIVTNLNAGEGDKVMPGEILVDIEKTEEDEDDVEEK